MSRDEELEKILNKLCNELVEYVEAGVVIVTFKEGTETKNGFLKFGNEYTIDGLINNIHDIMYSRCEDDDEDDDDDTGDLKNAIKKTLE
jgi:hypothetical protein